MSSAKIKKIIPCKKKQLIQMVLDIEKYPEFVPWCIEGKIYEKNESDDLVTFNGDLKVGKSILNETFSSHVSYLKDKDKIIVTNLDGPLKHLSEMILLDKYDKDGFDSKEEYKRVRKNISRRLLSTNKEVFPTIPEGMARIDTLREEKKDDKIGLEKVERINSHLEKLASEHESYL